MNKPEKIILHHALTKDSVKSLFSVNKIDAWHKARGFDRIGYHWYIDRDGIAHRGREDHETGAHTIGQNKRSIGICLEGMNFPTVAQIHKLCYLYLECLEKHGINSELWYPHSSFSDKECPGFDIEYLKGIFRMLEVRA